jgi:PKD repeat protein
VLLSGSTIQATAHVIDAGGNASVGTPVQFAVSTGQTATVITDGTGDARFTLEASSATTITATADGIATQTVTMRAVEPFTVHVSRGGDIRSPIWTALIDVQRAIDVVDPPLPQTVTLTCGDAGTVTLPGFIGAQSLPCAFRQDGTQTITAIATAANGWSSRSELQVTAGPPVSNPPVVPVTIFAYEVSRGGCGSEWRFVADSSQVRASLGRFEWDFGDGTTASTTTDSVSHRYTTRGVKVVTLTAITTDGRGRGTAREEIIVDFVTLGC